MPEGPGMDPTIGEGILGHWFWGRSVNERYGHNGDKELVDAIKSLRYDHKKTVIRVSEPPTRQQVKYGSNTVAFG